MPEITISFIQKFAKMKPLHDPPNPRPVHPVSTSAIRMIAAATLYFVFKHRQTRLIAELHE
jgi:hypothetical protein